MSEPSYAIWLEEDWPENTDAINLPGDDELDSTESVHDSYQLTDPLWQKLLDLSG
ncbi:MAG: hypothetical protein KatS3mg105_4130 [Gemmatales bacterium]|nr:MAG: hypothetical protein KatS3mg105_4130 [Gemmatales bacterium]